MPRETISSEIKETKNVIYLHKPDMGKTHSLAIDKLQQE